MDFLPDSESLSHWLINYGSFALFGLLILGIVAFPVPEESMLVIAGVLMNNGSLNIPETIIAAYAGSIVGISTSYILGRTAGNFLLKRYGSWVGITESHIKKGHEWFEKFGKWTLVIGYFIPGIRHLTGFLAGTTTLQYSHFALFAYSGAIIWVSTFLSVGYFFGNFWMSIYEYIEIGIDQIVIISVLILIVYFIYILKRTYKL